jgi:hypothetical protein
MDMPAISREMSRCEPFREPIPGAVLRALTRAGWGVNLSLMIELAYETGGGSSVKVPMESRRASSFSNSPMTDSSCLAGTGFLLTPPEEATRDRGTTLTDAEDDREPLA